MSDYTEKLKFVSDNTKKELTELLKKENPTAEPALVLFLDKEGRITPFGIPGVQARRLSVQTNERKKFDAIDYGVPVKSIGVPEAAVLIFGVETEEGCQTVVTNGGLVYVPCS